MPLGSRSECYAAQAEHEKRTERECEAEAEGDQDKVAVTEEGEDGVEEAGAEKRTEGEQFVCGGEV